MQYLDPPRVELLYTEESYGAALRSCMW